MSIKRLLLAFDGRITRSYFWTAILMHIGLLAAAGLAALFLQDERGVAVLVTAGLFVAYSGAAVFSKRWHDRGRSGLWSLVILVPGIGLAWMLWENGFREGQFGPNRYGPDPFVPAAVPFKGETYYRHRDLSYTDGFGNQIRDEAKIAMLSAILSGNASPT